MYKDISKSRFKAKTLKILRAVETTGRPVFVTVRGVRTWEIRRVSKKLSDMKHQLQGSVLYFDDPTGPVGEKWAAD